MNYCEEKYIKIGNIIKRFSSEEIFKNIEDKCIVVDFDDTLVKTRYINSYGHYAPIEPIIDAINFAKKKGFLIIIVTARAPETNVVTRINANAHKIKYDNLFTSVIFQINNKREIMNKIEQLSPKEIVSKKNTKELLGTKNSKENRTKIFLTIGDQWPDVSLPNTLGIKLPDSADQGAYFVFNGKKELIYV